MRTYFHNIDAEPKFINIINIMNLFILFVTLNNQTTNIVSPNFFPKIFLVLAVEKGNKLFIGPKQVVSQIWTNDLFFQLLKLGKIHGKNWGNKICGLVS